MTEVKNCSWGCGFRGTPAELREHINKCPAAAGAFKKQVARVGGDVKARYSGKPPWPQHREVQPEVLAELTMPSATPRS